MRQKTVEIIQLYWVSLRACIADIGQKNVALIAAGVAFYAMLSLFPALAALVAILSLVSDPVVVIAQLEDMRGLMPNDVYDIINGQVVSMVTTSSETLGWAGTVSLLVALWSARAGVGAMMIGLNSVYNERNRNAAFHYLRALLLTFGLVMVGIIALITVVIAPIVLSFVPLGIFGSIVAEVTRWTIAISVLLAGLGVLYRYGPNRRPARVGWLTFGAVFAVAAWAVVSIGFSYYVANFGNYNQVYGSIGAVIAMLVWLWISSFLVLMGASWNAQVELRTRVDSTIGPDRPRGKRGAVVADDLVSVDRG
ncbi:YihY/virulence factor BrkB family protein [Roseobacter sp. GAI101]|uniref:YihY/virulence factor BrkB family protein n=1 Tax=Roseobacter sp. (strain GAI101) TaxID=391589 RepID=UPI0003260703|nr:YihY/virulence factor BrkB family protein [Roseobacter sp. GAI101]